MFNRAESNASRKKWRNIVSPGPIPMIQAQIHRAWIALQNSLKVKTQNKMTKDGSVQPICGEEMIDTLDAEFNDLALRLPLSRSSDKQ